jgi:hypothetical protein
MTKVTIYPFITETVKGEDCELSDVLSWIKGGEWKEKVERVMAEPDKVKRTELKRTLPYFTGSGTFSRRTDEGLKEHSGRLVVDFDSMEDLEGTRELLCMDQYSEAVFLSCSANGLAVVVRIDPSRHLECFHFLEKYYKKTYNLQVDKSCKDVSRPRYISYDPALYINSNAKMVALPSGTIDDDESKYEWVLKCHEKKQAYVEGNRHNYLVILAYFCNKVGISQDFTLDRLIRSFGNEDKTPQEINKIVTYCYKHVEGFGTLVINKKFHDLPPEFAEGTKKVYATAAHINKEGRVFTEGDVDHAAQANGMSLDIVRGIFKNVAERHADEFGLNNKEEIEKLQHFIAKTYNVRRNIVLQKIEIHYKDGTEANVHDIYVDSLKVKFKLSLEKIRAVLQSRFVEKYDPFLEYFESLPDWKETEPDYIQELSNYVKTDNQEFWAIQLKKALVRSIACSIDFTVNRIVMVLVGEKQSTGKTSFIRWLCPPQLKKEYYTEAVMDSSKDAEFQLSDNFMWNLDELSSLSRQEITKLKAIISKDVVNLRRAFREDAERNRRRVNFWGTTNDDGFLTEGQNTRWLCFNIVSIDHNYNNWSNGKALDINKIWSQAYALYHAGYNYNLSTDEVDQQATTTVQFQAGSIEKDLITAYFVPCEKTNENAVFMMNSQILENLQSRVSALVRLQPNNIGKTMRMLGFKSDSVSIKGGKSARGWWIRLINSMPGDNGIYFDEKEKPKKF